jgi:O-antigen ligase
VTSVTGVTGAVARGRAAAAPTAPSFDDDRPIVIGATYVLLCELFVALTFIMQFGMVGYEMVGDQPLIWLGLVGWGGMLVVLAPVGSILKLKISLTVMAFGLWVGMSYFYSTNLDEWRRTAIRVAILPTLLMFVMTIIGFDRIIVVLKRLMWGAMAATFIAAVVIPGRTTRHIDAVTGEVVLPGWHGLFDHKNGLTQFLAIGIITFLSYEPVRTRRNATIGVAIVLVLLSQSATGLAVLLILLGTSATLRHFQNQPTTHRAGFLAMMIVVWSIAATAIVMLAARLVQLSGKDLTYSGRTKIWSTVLEQIGANPITGYGAGSVWVSKDEPTVSMRRQIGFDAANAHQGALELLLQVGVIGLVLYALVLVTVAGRAWMARHRAPATARWALLVVATTVLWSLSESVTMGPFFTLAALACVFPTDRDPIGLVAADPARSPSMVEATPVPLRR